MGSTVHLSPPGASVVHAGPAGELSGSHGAPLHLRFFGSSPRGMTSLWMDPSGGEVAQGLQLGPSHLNSPASLGEEGRGVPY